MTVTTGQGLSLTPLSKIATLEITGTARFTGPTIQVASAGVGASAAPSNGALMVGGTHTLINVTNVSAGAPTDIAILPAKADIWLAYVNVNVAVEGSASAQFKMTVSGRAGVSGDNRLGKTGGPEDSHLSAAGLYLVHPTSADNWFITAGSPLADLSADPFTIRGFVSSKGTQPTTGTLFATVFYTTRG